MEKPPQNPTSVDAGGTLSFRRRTLRCGIKPHVSTRRPPPAHTEFRQNGTETPVSHFTVSLGTRFVGAPGGFSRRAWEPARSTPCFGPETVRASGPRST